jgi:hypothetical protein
MKNGNQSKGETAPLLTRARSRQEEQDEVWAHEHQMDSIGKVGNLFSLFVTRFLVFRFIFKLCIDHK